MAIWFKFRSSVGFNSIDIDGRPSISVRDLKSKIVKSKKLDVSQDLDLVVSDASTGQEYDDEGFQIPSGSSIIIKRIPSKSASPATVVYNRSLGNSDVKNTDKAEVIGPGNMNAEVYDFDDFGVDLCLIPEAASSECNLDMEKYCINDDKENAKFSRCVDSVAFRCQKFEESVASEIPPRGHIHGGIGRNVAVAEFKSKVEEQPKLAKGVNDQQLVQNTELPSELRCSLCDTFFKEAVMITCCQHSFCQKCIRTVLVEKARCPRCYSSKCRVEDLLPNLSLRRAIDHFLESQIPINGADDRLRRDAPDGESGIQAKDASCAVTVHLDGQDLACPSAGKESNHILAESVYSTGSHINQVPALLNAEQIGNEKDGSPHPPHFGSANFQGEYRYVHMPQSHIDEEAESTVRKKKELCANTAGGAEGFIGMSRHKKGDRTCYMCGSPSHFIRDCPVARSRHAMHQTAMPSYESPYWNVASSPHLSPFANLYGSPGIMPFNMAMVPRVPFAVPSYVTPMHAGTPYGGLLRFTNGLMGMGGMALPAGTNADNNLSHSELLDIHDPGNRQTHSTLYFQRKRSCGTEHLVHNETGRSHDHESQRERERSPCYSGDRHEKSSRSSAGGKVRKPSYHSRSSSEGKDASVVSDTYKEERDRHLRRSYKKDDEKRGKHHLDSSKTHHRTGKKDGSPKVEHKSDVRRHHHKYHNNSDSGMEPSFSSDRSLQKRERDLCRSSRYSRRGSTHTSDELTQDRWQMVSCSDEDGREHNQLHKRKRVF